MPPMSTAELANANATDAARSAEDALALITWLIERVEALETIAGLPSTPRPELPSERTQRIYREAREQDQAAFRERTKAEIIKNWPYGSFLGEV